MRKLLLSTTAIAASTILVATVAQADLSVTGSYKWSYTTQSSDIAATDGTLMENDSEIKFAFANKTEENWTVGFDVEMETDAAGIDESNMYVTVPNFGTVKLGQQDGAADSFKMLYHDHNNPTVNLDTDSTLNGTTAGAYSDNLHALTIGDDNKVTYLSENIEGLTFGASALTTVAGTVDESQYGARYEREMGAADVTVSYSMARQGIAQMIDGESKNYGVQAAVDNWAVRYTKASYTAASTDLTASGIGGDYTLPSGIKLSAGKFKSENTNVLATGEKLDSNIVAMTLPIVSGLNGYLSYTAFDYANGLTSAATIDSGSATKASIKASF